MRCSRITTAVLVGASLVAALGGTAAASPVGTVSPAKAKPGQTVSLTLRGCSDPSKGGRAEGEQVGRHTSERTPIRTVELKPAANGTLVGIAAIERNTQAGVAQIYMACASDPDTVVTVDVTVTG
ncbi:hypothetical protein SRB17_01810 [Streptomyces sp. RB17]|uniref:hypothetical protein n=1 Tax=Streptomyces sp. RB17 TaxID=2585197 RepID=UPI001296C52E|nr:hypothetical protein [Streptomyces sp. RB17]MQY32238.1 hypothetical protein [Streptomyces sp. RB17]